jgi:hypothetical protein
MSTKKERMYQAIEEHGKNLNEIFHTKFDNITLAKRLHSLEAKAHRLATDYCNGENGVDTENWDEKIEPILKAVEKITGMDRKQAGFFVNGDARGYALKIDADIVKENALDIHQDWGGYGILAPDFSETK